MELAWIADNKGAVMIGLFLVFLLWEAWRPVVTERPASHLGRWLFNYLLYLAAYGVSVALYAIPALWGAHWAGVGELGLFNRIDAPLWLEGALGLLILDLSQYGLHRAMHGFSFLWRFHRLHHSDTDVDLTTGFRFHPVEACLQIGMHIAVTVLLGLSPIAVLLYWLLLVFSNYFSHANVRIAESTDGLLQRLIITPSLHRLHHHRDSQDPFNNYNYGSLLSLWDRGMQTFKPAGTLVQQSRQTFGVAPLDG